MTIVDEYLSIHEKYAKKYGNDKTVLLMAVGSFHELYCTNSRGAKLSVIAELLGMVLTKKDKKIAMVDERNPYMMGFPSVVLNKYLRVLVDHGYTVVVIDQVTLPPNPKRRVTGVYSEGTLIHDTMGGDANNIVALYIEDELQKDNTMVMCIGMSVIDLSTGENVVHESYSVNGDEKYALDEAVRFINSYQPKETLIYRKSDKSSMTKDNLVLYLELDTRTYFYYTEMNKSFYKVSYQNEFLGRLFPDFGMLTPIEYLDMEKMRYATISFLYLLDYSYQHNENIINNIYQPKVFSNERHMILGNNAVFQLNILENSMLDVMNNTKFKSLFDVVNNSSTAMGRRYLKNMLVAPLTNSDEIELLYNCTEEVLDKYEYLEEYLKGMLDIERLNRRLVLSILQPYEFAGMIECYKKIDILIKFASKSKYLKKQLPDKVVIKQLDSFFKDVDKKFNLDELKKNNLNEIISSFFNVGVYKDVDKLQSDINGNEDFMESICKVLSEYIENSSRFKFKKSQEKEENGDDKIYLKKNDRDGYYLSLTKLRAKSLQKNISALKEIKINDNLSIKTEKLTFKDLPKGNTKIFIEDMSTKSDDTVVLKDKLTSSVIGYYTDIIKQYINEYSTMFRQMAKFIAVVDYVKSNAKTAKLNNYVKPIITRDSNRGYIRSEKLRHPIVEKIRTDVEYVSHDIKLGGDNEISGMLVYGINSCGKTILAKAIGLSLVMAQSGMFVPASKYEYSPYSSIYARITGTDNLFKGLSSFALEMTELRAILKRANPKTLVIGDELTRGTEHISGTSIVATSIINLAKAGATFIFATHLHEVAKMERIKSLSNVKAFHLSVEYDKEKDSLVFDRKLKIGSGEEIYGLTVAKYIIHDAEFIKLAQEIKNELLEQPGIIVSDKTSKYNANVYMHECAVCKKKFTEDLLDTHHINFQKDCVDGFVKSKPQLKKDAVANLVVLCKDCHIKVHQDKIEIPGFLDTSKGRRLKVKEKAKI